MRDFVTDGLSGITDSFVISNPYLLKMHKEADVIQDLMNIPADQTTNGLDLNENLICCFVFLFFCIFVCTTGTNLFH